MQNDPKEPTVAEFLSTRLRQCGKTNSEIAASWATSTPT